MGIVRARDDSCNNAATHRDDHALLSLPVLALLIGCARQDAAGGGPGRAAAGDLRHPDDLSPPSGQRDSCRCQGVSAVVLWADGPVR